MVEKILLHLIILSGVLYQGIIATSSNHEIQESSSLLAREKRVITLEPGNHRPVPIQHLYFMTTIKENHRVKCAGVILSHYSVITAASCLRFEYMQYTILSGSGYAQTSVTHTITTKATYYGNDPHNKHDTDGIAMLTVDPPFTFGQTTGTIQLYTGPITEGTQATVSGWGCNYPLMPPPSGYQRRLRQISIPIMNHEACQNDYRHNFTVSYKHICTYHNQKYCARGDLGAPLIVEHKLAGIFVYKGEFPHQMNPEIFINLQVPGYREWINRHALLM